MKSFGAPTALYVRIQAGLIPRILVDVFAVRKGTGQIERFGMWNGDEPIDLDVGGTSRSYLPQPGKVMIDEIIAQPGPEVMFSQLKISALSPEILDAIEKYEIRFAAVELHRVLFYPQSMELVDAPTRIFKGWVDRAPMPRPAVGGEASLALTLASANRALHRPLPHKKSDAALSAARNRERFRRYTDAGSVDAPWGQANGGAQ